MIFDDDIFLEHVPLAHHPERPARLVAMRSGVHRSGVALRRERATVVSHELLQKVHDPNVLQSLLAVNGPYGLLDADTYVVPSTAKVALHAAGAAALLSVALGQRVEHCGLALLRPPGHHAERRRSMGFCLLNNVAVAAESWIQHHGGRVAIVDLDVHHGNGTQDIFYERPDVLFISIHQAPLYPGSGLVSEQGATCAPASTVNIPLAKQADDLVYQEAFRRIVLPKIRKFQPNYLLVSLGLDAYEHDPLANMKVTATGFATLVSALQCEARERNIPMGLVTEGGYELSGLESCLIAVCRGLFEPKPLLARELPMTRESELCELEFALS